MKKLNLDDSVHIEIPINENETSIDLKYFAEIVHEKDVILSVDITSIHPSLQDPFKLEADIVIQSATKYCDRCSEVLAVLIFVKTQDMKNRLLIDRIFWAVTLPIWKHSLKKEPGEIQLTQWNLLLFSSRGSISKETSFKQLLSSFHINP